MSTNRKSAALAGLVAMVALALAGCQVQPPRGAEPKPADPAAQQQADREAQQEAQERQQAARAARQRREAEQRRGAEHKRQEAERAARQEQCLGSVQELKDIHVRWQRVERQANTAPRIKLPIPLGNLRKIRKELEESADAPSSAKAKGDLAKGMGLTETFFVNFLGNNRKYLKDQKTMTAEGKGDRQVAKQLLDAAAADLARIEACKGAC